MTELFAARGLVIGKFWPPHRGHSNMIRFASANCDTVTVAVCDDERQLPDAATRAGWLQELHPDADVVIVSDICAGHWPDVCEDRCSALWAAHVRESGLGDFDIVVSGERYGVPFAAALGARHLHFDRGDGPLAVSATAVRTDLANQWPNLEVVVRAGLCRRVVILGAESTGTTTLARDLAAHCGVPVTHEAGRIKSWAVAARHHGISNYDWDEHDFWEIAQRQIGLEQSALNAAANVTPGPLGPWIVCDTDVLATAVWWERYLDVDAGAMFELAATRPGDLYVVTSPDGVTFHQDGIRDGAHVRQRMHDRFLEVLGAVGANHVVVAGDPGERVRTAVQAMARTVADRPLFGSLQAPDRSAMTAPIAPGDGHTLTA